MKHISIFLALFSVSFFSIAGGSQVNLQGQKQQGMGHLGTAFTLGAENLFFNPGSIGFLQHRTMFSGGINGIIGTVVFQPENEREVYRTEPGISTPFNLYATHQINKKWSAGLGVFIPFGSTVEWEEEWKGRYILQKVELRTFNIQPTLSYKVNERLGIGLGGIIGIGSVLLEKDIPVESNNDERYYARLEGSDVSFGFNIGVYYDVNDKWKAGVTYRSGIEYEVEDGDATFFRPESLSDRFPKNNSFDASLPLPSTTSFALTHKASERLGVGVEFNFVGWSVYERLKIDFEENTESLDDVNDRKDYKSGIIARVGAAYACTEEFTVRLGAYFDRTPVNERYWGPETPDMNKVGLTTGFTYQLSDRGAIDLSYIFIYGAEREVRNVEQGFSGTAKAVAHVPGIGFSYNF